MPVRGLRLCLALFATALAARAAESTKKSFDVPADAAEKSIKLFSQQAGLEVLFPTDIARGVRTQPIKGEMPARQALETMLNGTGLVIFEDRTGAFSIQRGTADPNVPRAALPTPSVRPRPSRDEAAGEKTIEMSPFTVNADQDIGYVANSSLAGSRLNTPLRDTAASISVLTAEFLSDIAATNIQEALEWANNVQMEVTDGNGGSDNESLLSFPAFRVRGIAATVTRNYFPWKLSTDSYNLDRIEEQRGPNSILFGIGAAGGVLNSSTKQAVFGRNFRRGQVQVGSFDSYRGSFDVNQGTFNDRLAVRFNAVYSRKRSSREHVFDRTRRVDLAATWRATKSTIFRAEYEAGDIDQVNSRTVTMWDGITTWLAAGRPTVAAPVTAAAQLSSLGLVNVGTAQRITYIGNSNQLINLAGQNTSNGPSNLPITDESLASRSINTGGPGQKRTGGFDALSLFADQRIGENTFVQLAYNHQGQSSLAYLAGQGRSENNRLKADPNRTLPGGVPNPFAGRLMIEGDRWTRRRNNTRSDNTRLMLSHEQDFGRWGNYRVAGMGEYEWRAERQFVQVEAWEGSPFNANPENANNLVWRRSYVVEGEWSTYYENGPAELGLILNLPNPLPGAGRPATISSTWAAFNQNGIDNPDYQKTLLFGGQARYFKGRIVLGLGYRRDSLDRTERLVIRDPVTNQFANSFAAANTRMTNNEARTKTLGAVVHMNRFVSLFYNYSNSFSLPNAIRVLPDSSSAPSPESEGSDYGIAFTLLDGRLNARFNHYENELNNGTDFRFGGTDNNPTVLNNMVLRVLVDNRLLTQAEMDARVLNTTGITFSRRVEGYEANVTANLSKNWRLQANYSYTRGSESEIAPEVKTWAAVNIPFFQRYPQNLTASDGRTIAQIIADWQRNATQAWALEGVTMAGNRKHKVNVFSRYNLPWERFKGVYFGGGYRHMSKSEVGLDAGLNVLHGNSFWLADAMAGYRIARAPFFKRGVSLQLNVTNVFDWRAPVVTGLGGTVSNPVINRWNILEPRTWKLRASVEF